MHALLKLARLIDAINGVIGRAVYWLVLAMVLVGAYNSIARYSGRYFGMNLTHNMLLETQWYLFSIVFLFMAAYALNRDAHVRVDILFSRASPRTQAIIDLIGTLVFLIPFCILIIYMSRNFVTQSIAILERSPDPGGLPRWPIKLAIPIAFVLLALQGVSQAIKAAAVLAGILPQHRDTETEAGKVEI